MPQLPLAVSILIMSIGSFLGGRVGRIRRVSHAAVPNQYENSLTGLYKCRQTVDPSTAVFASLTRSKVLAQDDRVVKTYGQTASAMGSFGDVTGRALRAPG